LTLKCGKPGCPNGCGTRARPGCVDRLLGRVLFLALAAVLLFSLVVGLRRLTTPAAWYGVPVMSVAAPCEAGSQPRP
jgi:hypothetical protein